MKVQLGADRVEHVRVSDNGNQQVHMNSDLSLYLSVSKDYIVRKSPCLFEGLHQFI